MTPATNRAGEAWAGLVTAYCLAVAVGVVARDYLRERKRVAQVAADTTADLNSRAAEIEAKTERMISGEHNARYDTEQWGEPARDPYNLRAADGGHNER